MYITRTGRQQQLTPTPRRGVVGRGWGALAGFLFLRLSVTQLLHGFRHRRLLGSIGQNNTTPLDEDCLRMRMRPAKRAAAYDTAGAQGCRSVSKAVRQDFVSW